MFIDTFASIVVNNEDVYIWGEVYPYIDDDFRTQNENSIKFIDNE